MSRQRHLGHNLSMIVSEEAVETVGVYAAWLGLCICFLGICTNIVNIIIFVRQGLGDRMTVSLLCLVVSDLGSVITQAWATLCFTSSFMSLDLPFVPEETQYLIGGLPHLVFTRVGMWNTVYISLEKCFCVVMPLKVKGIFTTKRAGIFIVIIYLVMTGSIAPVYYTTRFTWTVNKSRNTSQLTVWFIENRNTLETASFYINNIIPASAFIVITVSTIVLIFELKHRAKWRKMSSLSTKAVVLSHRETRLIVTVVSLSAAFILCYSPGTALILWMIIDDELRMDGRERNLYILFYSFIYIFEAVNASMNFFIYLCTASRYQEVFYDTFSCTHFFKRERGRKQND